MKQSEVKRVKKLLTECVKFDPDMTGADANTMIQDAAVSALDKLPDDEKLLIDKQAKILQDRLKNCGPRGAYEILAALGCVKGINAPQ